MPPFDMSSSGIKPDMATLEATIKQLTNVTARCEDSLQITRLARLVSTTRNVRIALRNWLALNGISLGDSEHSSIESLAKAYIFPNYLGAWRKRNNQAWNSLAPNEPGLELLDENAEAPISPPAAPQAGPGLETKPSTLPPAAGAPANHAQTEAWLKTLFAQIETTVNKLVDTKVKNTEVQIGPKAKEQIQAIVKETAAATVAAALVAALPPRQIEITNVATNTTINVGIQHEKFPLLLRAVSARDHRGFRLNIWLTGPTGSGKTTAAENVSKALSLAFGSDGSLDADYKVLGFRDANGHIISTQFLEIYEHGGIYVADEIDNWQPSALLSLNAALSNGWAASPRGLIKRHPDACIIACANTWGLGATGDYVGRTRLDAASLDRFQPKIDWPIDEKLERAVAKAQGGIEGEAWHSVVTNARAAAKRQGLKIIISPRATFGGIALLAQGFDETEVALMTFASGLSPEQRKAIGLG